MEDAPWAKIKLKRALVLGFSWNPGACAVNLADAPVRIDAVLYLYGRFDIWR